MAPGDADRLRDRFPREDPTRSLTAPLDRGEVEVARDEDADRRALGHLDGRRDDDRRVGRGDRGQAARLLGGADHDLRARRASGQGGGGGANLGRAEIIEYVGGVVDIAVQLTRRSGRRLVSEVAFSARSPQGPIKFTRSAVTSLRSSTG